MTVTIKKLGLESLCIRFKIYSLECFCLAGFALNVLGIKATYRVVSKLKILWSIEKIHLEVFTVSNLVIVNCNFEDCKRFFIVLEYNRFTTVC